MSISRITAIIIKERDDLLITHSGPDEHGKYAGWITYPSEQNCRPLLNTKYVFDTPELAEEHMKSLTADIKAANL